MKQLLEPAERELVITRVFDAPRQLVFNAWTDQRHVAKWWGPKDFSVSECEIDLRVGGAFRLQMRGPDGVVYPCRGVYDQIVEPERIVIVSTADDDHPCGAGLPPRAVVTITLVERAGKTTLTHRTLWQSAADQEAATESGYNPGWNSCLDRLAEYVAKA